MGGEGLHGYRKNHAREKLMKKKPYMWSTNPKNIFMHWPKKLLMLHVGIHT